jgi:hypothetical protein
MRSLWEKALEIHNNTAYHSFFIISRRFNTEHKKTAPTDNLSAPQCERTACMSWSDSSSQNDVSEDAPAQAAADETVKRMT